MGSSDKLQCVIDLLSKTISSGNIPFADEINALTSELKIVVSIRLVCSLHPTLLCWYCINVHLSIVLQKVVLFHKYDDIEHLKISFIKKTVSMESSCKTLISA